MIFPPAGLIAAALQILSVRAGHKADSYGDIANDPPRDDYELPVTLQEPENEAGFADDPIVLAMSDLVRAIDQTVAYEQAMVLADERALGAKLAGDGVSAAARTTEALRFGMDAAERNRDLLARTELVAGLLEESPIDPIVTAALRAAGIAAEDYGRLYLRDRGLEQISGV
jgi:hypothetical protein